MDTLFVQIGHRDSIVNEIELVHLVQLIFEVSNHDVVWLDVTMDETFVMHRLDLLDQTNTDAHDCFRAKVLFVPFY
jgi:hypothetical protein